MNYFPIFGENMKLLRYLPLIVVALLNLLGCSKDDEQYNTHIIGTWEMTHWNGRAVTDYPQGIPYGFPVNTTLTFESGGAYYGTGFFNDGFGEYSINGRNIVITMSGIEKMSYIIKSIDRNTAVLDAVIADDPTEIKLKKMN